MPKQGRGQIGKGGDKLIPMFLSADEQREHGKVMEEWRGAFKTAYLPLLRPFSAVPDLPRPVRDAGVRLAIASSAKKDELASIWTLPPLPTWSMRLPLPQMPKNLSPPPTSSRWFTGSSESQAPMP
jgi:hypothetical protein